MNEKIPAGQEHIPNIRGITIQMRRLTSIQECYQLLQNHPDVKPNEVTMNIFYNKLIRFREGGKVDSSALGYIEAVVEADSKLKGQILADPRTLIVRAICHFAADQSPKGWNT